MRDPASLRRKSVGCFYFLLNRSVCCHLGFPSDAKRKSAVTKDSQRKVAVRVRLTRIDPKAWVVDEIASGSWAYANDR